MKLKIKKLKKMSQPQNDSTIQNHNNCILNQSKSPIIILVNREALIKQWNNSKNIKENILL